jgi:prepilin-type N-terminal cleavage/methylation domain-containing protein
MRKLKKDPLGFTLIELMIVVAIIGVLAAISIPRFGQMLEKSREGTTKGNLNSIHSATFIYYGDQKGIWPTTLNTSSLFSFSQYLDVVNPVKVTGYFITGAVSPAGTNVNLTSQSSAPTGSGVGWLYDSSEGAVFDNSTVKDSKDIPYSFYGFE